LRDTILAALLIADYLPFRRGLVRHPIEVARDASAKEIARLKPHPLGLLTVAALLGVRPERCLIIGDRDDRDGEAARRGGFRFLM
jgi:beta-phosphoglucomutase-like phosphatase (HAD superfamily)